MPGREVVTRADLRRELVVNAATKPLALGVGAGVAAAAFFFGVGWLLLAAVALYLAIALATFFDGDEAERVGKETRARARTRAAETRALPKGLTPDLKLLVERARAEERRLLEAIEELDVPYGEVAVEVDRLTAEMERIAPRAQLIANYLNEQRPDDIRRRLHALRRESSGRPESERARKRTAAALNDQLRVYNALDGELERFRVEMEHLIASLGVVRGELVRMSVADEAVGQASVAAQVRDLRERVGTVADGISEAAEQLEAPPPE